MNSLGHLREFWSPASQSERSVAGGCHFNYLMQDLAGDRPSHMFASLFFPPVISVFYLRLIPRQQLVMGAGYCLQEVSGYCWLTSYLLSSGLSAELPSESGLHSVRARGERACVIAEHAL